MLFSFTGCGGEKAQKAEVLTPVKVSEIRTVNGRQVPYYKGEPYLFYPVHMRYDHIMDYIDEELTDSVLEQAFQKVKESGFESVLIYAKWEKMYDGKEYDLTWFTKQFKLAEKYDLKVHIAWIGSNNCGFGGYMPWQTDYKKYPSLKNKEGSLMLSTTTGARTPDFSAPIFAEEECEGIRRICDWLNKNDKDRRTVAIQLENEPGNSEGGNGLWMSQFTNMVNHLNNLGRAVKESPYSMVTYLNLMSAGTQTTVEGYDLKGRIHKLIDQEYIDIVGWDIYTNKTTPRDKNIEYGKNLPVFAEMGICAYSVPGQINYCFNNGYGMGFYMFVNAPDTTSNNGFYRWRSALTGLEKRDGTQIIPVNQLDTMGGKEELKYDEVVAMNQSIRAIRELIATQRTTNIVVFNNTMKNVVSNTKVCNKIKITYICNRPNEKYGSSGLLIGAEDGNYYMYSSQDADYKFEATIKEVTAGTYKDGKWTASETVTFKDNTFTAKAGLAYRVILA